MTDLFPGEPRPLPARKGPTWVVAADEPPPPPPVRHAIGYQSFLDLAARFGTDAAALLDTWTFAHFVRAHREALTADPDLQLAAVVFLGNAFIREHPDCVWKHGTPGFRIETEDERYDRVDGVPTEVPGHTSIIVEGTLQAILDADEARFADFQATVDRWGPGSAGRAVPPRPRFDSKPDPSDRPPTPPRATAARR